MRSTWTGYTAKDLERASTGYSPPMVSLYPAGLAIGASRGKIEAARIARVNRIPYLGLCLGMQVMCIELARHVFDTHAANSTEFEPSRHINHRPDARSARDRRHRRDDAPGQLSCVLTPGTRA